MHSKTFFHFLFAVLLIFSVMAVYGNTLHSPFLFDDYGNIVNNGFLKITSLSWEHIAYVWDAPHPSENRKIPNLTFALNYYLDGLNPFGYHVVNIGIHIICSLLAALFFMLSLKAFSPDGVDRDSYPLIVWSGAFLWALHPIQINAVTYIVQRMTSLALLFSLMALNAWLIGRKYVHQNRGRSVLCFILSFIFLGFALLCKEYAVIIPFLIGIHEFFLLRKGKINIKGWHFLVLGVSLIAVVLFYVGPRPWEWLASGYSHRDFTLWERMMTEPRVLWHYVSLFFLPAAERFVVLHEYPVSKGLFTPFTTFLSILMWVATIVSGWKMRKQYPVFTWAVAWFLAAHLVESTIIPLEIIFEHRMYLPSLALAFGTSYLIFTHSAFRSFHPRFRMVLMAVLIASVGMSTYIRNMDFSDIVTLYRADLEKYPSSKRMRLNLAVALNRQKNYQESGKILADLVKSYPNDILVLQNWHLYLMKVQKNDREADKIFHHIITLLDRGEYNSYRDSTAIWKLAHYFNDHNNPERALMLVDRLAVDYDYDSLWFFKGRCYVKLKDWNSAVSAFNEAWQRNSTDPPILYWYGRSLIQTGKKRRGMPLITPCGKQPH